MHQRDTPACNPAPATTSPGRPRQQLLFRAIIRHPRLPRLLLLRFSLNPPCFVHSVHGLSPALKLSSITQLLQKFASISATSALCRRSTRSVAPPTVITIATLILARLKYAFPSTCNSIHSPTQQPRHKSCTQHTMSET
ncbi:hypothetical protein AMECASPLE_002181 [Ameca splendens]|uniref:Uncharacterized protein n=1 Tax=Ameca splendens TaxID=208324 RepID=A0ABV0ZJ59_9TELE